LQRSPQSSGRFARAIGTSNLQRPNVRPGRNAIADASCRYHSAATLKTMKAFCIGRKPPGVWVNTAPPVRGGVHRKHVPLSFNAECEDDSADDEGGAATHLYPDGAIVPPGGIHLYPEGNVVPPGGMRCRVPVLETSTESVASSGRCLVFDAAASSAKDASVLSAAKYADWAVLREVDQDTLDFPSLCPLVQQEIVHKYRALHQRVYDEGFYNCPYLEYGKEIARYICLFSAFIVALRYEWYLVSAVFLGLFWVSQSSAPDTDIHTDTDACSIKSCFRRTMRVIAPLPRSLSSTRSSECLSPTSAAACRLDGGRAATTSIISSPTSP